MNDAQLNHLRRLLAWIECEIGQSPEEYLETMLQIAPLLDPPDEAAQKRMVESYRRSQATPKYVRAAIKALQPLTIKTSKDVDGLPMPKELPAPHLPRAL